MVCRKPKATLPVAGSASARTVVGGALDLGEGPLDGGEEGAAGRGEGDRAALAGEQVDAQVLFEADHRPRQRRLRDAHLLRGARDVLVPGDSGEVREARGEQDVSRPCLLSSLDR